MEDDDYHIGQLIQLLKKRQWMFKKLFSHISWIVKYV